MEGIGILATLYLNNSLYIAMVKEKGRILVCYKVRVGTQTLLVTLNIFLTDDRSVLT